MSVNQLLLMKRKTLQKNASSKSILKEIQTNCKKGNDEMIMSFKKNATDTNPIYDASQLILKHYTLTTKLSKNKKIIYYASSQEKETSDVNFKKVCIADKNMKKYDFKKYDKNASELEYIKYAFNTLLHFASNDENINQGFVNNSNADKTYPRLMESCINNNMLTTHFIKPLLNYYPQFNGEIAGVTTTQFIVHSFMSMFHLHVEDLFVGAINKLLSGIVI